MAKRAGCLAHGRRFGSEVTKSGQTLPVVSLLVWFESSSVASRFIRGERANSRASAVCRRWCVQSGCLATGLSAVSEGEDGGRVGGRG